MKKLILKMFGIKGIKAWAIIGDDDFLLVQNRPDMDCQIYVDSQGRLKDRRRDNLKIVPCEVVF